MAKIVTVEDVFTVDLGLHLPSGTNNYFHYSRNVDIRRVRREIRRVGRQANRHKQPTGWWLLFHYYRKRFGVRGHP
jgi:late competence protein required for DNA uptake (superfamily II DNA/RNA helicase)